MYVDYYETSALIGVGKPGELVTLDLLHKAAWSVFTGSGVFEIPRNTPRPFVFSADAVPGRDNVYLMVIRAPVEFPRATRKTAHFQEGDTWQFGLHFKGLASTKSWDHAKQAFHVKRQTVSEENIESRIIRPSLSRHGFEVLKVELMGPTYRKHQSKGRQAAFPPLWYGTIEGVVSDPLLMANALTSGVTHGRAYGFGMLSILSAPKSEKVVS